MPSAGALFEVTYVSTHVESWELVGMRATLDATERERADAFRKPDDQRRFIVAHAAVRRLLGERLGRAPATLEFVIGEHGKPALADGAAHFNLSHSGDVAAIAFGPGPVGVDVEAPRSLRRVHDLAASTFAPGEIARVRDAADPLQAFLQIWTAKEAVVKATGLGLTLEVATFEVPQPGPTPLPVRVLHGDPALAQWHVAHFDAGRGHYGAVAAAGDAWRVALR